MIKIYLIVKCYTEKFFKSCIKKSIFINIYLKIVIFA